MDYCYFSGGAVVKNPLTSRRQRVRSLGWENTLEEGMATHSSILAWEIPWTEVLAGYTPWGSKELDATERSGAH